jgi:protein-S-isoprenylcysteine O-methyltransferase Ste14
MLNSDLLKTRLSQYGAAWLLAFALGLLLTLAVPPLSHMRLVQVADVYLPLAFLLLGLALLGGLVLGLLSSETFLVKVVFVVLGLILALPLFWARFWERCCRPTSPTPRSSIPRPMRASAS